MECKVIRDEDGAVIGLSTPYAVYTPDFDDEGVLVGIKESTGFYHTVVYSDKFKL